MRERRTIHNQYTDISTLHALELKKDILKWKHAATNYRRRTEVVALYNTLVCLDGWINSTIESSSLFCKRWGQNHRYNSLSYTYMTGRLLMILQWLSQDRAQILNFLIIACLQYDCMPVGAARYLTPYFSCGGLGSLLLKKKVVSTYRS